MILVLQILRYKKNYFCRPEMFCKKVFLKIFQNSQENTWKKGSGTSASCEFSEIFKNNFIYKTPMVAGFFKYMFFFLP